MSSKMSYRPLNKDSWLDFENLFGERGACAGCWCMYWRLPRSQYEAQKYEGNRLAMKQLVDSGVTPGIMGYVPDHLKPVAWISVGPREDYPSLKRSRILKPVDDLPVWSVSCLFVDKRFRELGISTQMIRYAIDFVGENGGQVLEAYPVEPRKDRMHDAFAWTGLASAFLAAGFHEVARRSDTRPVMRILT